MKTSIIFSLFIILFTQAATASVLKSYDSENSCDLYMAVPNPVSPSGNTLPPIPKEGEVIIYAKEVYGLSFQDMDINFDNREVNVQPIMNIMMGFNRSLTTAKAIIPAEHPDFKYLINQLNRKVSLFEKICLRDAKVVYARPFPEPKSNN